MTNFIDASQNNNKEDYEGFWEECIGEPMALQMVCTMQN
jgi:hypothetical protein